MSSDIAFASTSALAYAIRSKTIGCVELLDHYLARIERLNGCVNAVVTLDVEAARAHAERADAALARREAWGPLHGVPFTVKDSFETADLLTTCGHEPLREHVPTDDAIAVARLRMAGAVVFGKTNTPMLASDVQTYNALFGTTRNPWNADRTSGGSSGGAAAALAAGLTGGDFGSDIGGSIRTPSNWCGVYGHKPSWGIIPQRGHIPGPPGSLSESDLNVVGPMGRGADDLDIALEATVGPLPEDAMARSIALPSPRCERLGDYRIAAWMDHADYPVDDAVRAVHERMLDALRARGATIDDTVRPEVDLAEVVRTYLTLLLPLVLAGLPREQDETLVALAAELPPDLHQGLEITARSVVLRHRDWLVANERRQQIRARLGVFFREWDALLLPVTPVAAIPHDVEPPIPERMIEVNGAQRSYYDLFSWIAPATMAYLPATVVPVGRTADGLPVGVQVVGPYLEDRTTVDLGRRIGEIVGGYEAPPGFE